MKINKDAAIRILFTILLLIIIFQNNHWSVGIGFLGVFLTLELIGKMLAGILKDIVKIINKLD